jgi:cyclopropane fatty-acyl-phospholipid synthase-like methyltransferase
VTEIAIGTLAWLILGLVFIIFGLIPLKGAPWVPSLKRHTEAAFKLLDLKPGQTVIDLGCGDGRFLKQAAKRGYKAVGYELNPFMYAIARLVNLRCRKNVSLVLGDFWKADISKADAVYVFLFDRYMKQLDDKLKSEGKKGLKLASHTFQIPDRKAAAQDYGVYLYKY